MKAKVFASPQALLDATGTPLGPTAWLTVTQEMIDLFARATGDHQWIHVDVERATKEIGFVRTGFGGEKVVINGGALVLPVLHETMPVNLNTVRLAVKRMMPRGPLAYKQITKLKLFAGPTHEHQAQQPTELKVPV